MAIKTEHNGYEITYSENEDLWRCWTLELEAKTLSALKTKMNKLDADRRRLDMPQVWHLTYSGPKLKKATLIEDGAVWLLAGGDDKRGRQREKVGLENTVIDTPANRQAIEMYVAAEEVARKAQRTAYEMRQAIPRATAADLMALKVRTEDA
jgi:hypothetical protein